MLRLVVFMFLMPIDTSECERVFSLLKDIKTSLREALRNDTLNWLIHWHRASKGKKAAECPVPAILAQYRADAGPRGRYKHTTPE